MLAGIAVSAHAQRGWQQQEFFQNSGSQNSYFYSEGHTSGPSTLELIDKKLPLDTTNFVSAPDALRISWQSTVNGAWDAEIRLPSWPNRYVDFTGDTLYLWVYSASSISAADLPLICLRDSANGFTERLKLGEFLEHPAAGKWTRVAIPMTRFKSASMYSFQPTRTDAIVLLQGAADGVRHQILLDDIRIEDRAATAAAVPRAPTNLRATGYERHVLLTWDLVPDEHVAQYVIYRSLNGGPFVAVNVQRPNKDRAVDFIGDPHAQARYRISARTSSMIESPMSNEAARPPTR